MRQVPVHQAARLGMARGPEPRYSTVAPCGARHDPAPAMLAAGTLRHEIGIMAYIPIKAGMPAPRNATRKFAAAVSPRTTNDGLVNAGLVDRENGVFGRAAGPRSHECATRPVVKAKAAPVAPKAGPVAHFLMQGFCVPALGGFSIAFGGFSMFIAQAATQIKTGQMHEANDPFRILVAGTGFEPVTFGL